MDYVVFGTGYGATLMLLGWALRTFGPGLRYQDDEDDSPANAEMIMRRFSWRRFMSALGAVIATSGVALVLITFITVLFGAGNMTGTWIILTCYALILIAVAVWTWFYVERYGVYGILPEHFDYMNLLRSRSRTDEPVLHSQTNPDSGDNVTTMAESDVYHNEDVEIDDAGGDAFVDDHDDAFDEQEARYAKYIVHHPDDVVDSFRDSPDVNEDIIEADTDSEPEFEEDVEATAVVPSGDEVSDGVENDEPIASDEMSRNADEGTAIAGTDDPESAHTRDEAETGLSHSLPDTPERRAEALRRIQEWEPDENDDENDVDE